MEGSHFDEPVVFATPPDEKFQSPPIITHEGPGTPALASQAPGRPRKGPSSSVFVFNPFAEGFIAHGRAFTPVKHQALLAADLANLPQFLCQPDDVVLVAKRPSMAFLNALKQAGFPPPEFVEFREGRINPADGLCQRLFRSLRPWAWGPDSVKLFEPLFARLPGDAGKASHYFNDNIAQLYSKAWSVGFLRKVLARCRGWREPSSAEPQAHTRPDAASVHPWLCSEQEAGVAVDTLEDALKAVAAIRGRGHHRVVVKEAHGLAGQNAIRLWEPGLLPAQRRWLAHAAEDGQQLVVEPWLERELDFSVQLEMRPSGLELRGYTGLINDRKGQFLANWAEPNYRRCLPMRVAASLQAPQDISDRFQHLYREIFSLLEAELQRVSFIGPVSIDAFIYRTAQGDCRLKPVVEINPRYTMGRLTVELMQRTCPGSHGLFRLVSHAQARAEGCADLSGYARSLGKRSRLCLEGEPVPGIRRGTLCLNDPAQAQVCLATFEVSNTLNLPGALSDNENQRSR